MANGVNRNTTSITTVKRGTNQVEKIMRGSTLLWQNFIPITATGGDIVGTYTLNGVKYKYHQFNSSGNFIITNLSNVEENNKLEYLIIAGGGGVGSRGGGGAGGYRSSVVGELSGKNTQSENRINASIQNYQIIVGGGASAGTNQGGKSSAFGIESIGGGGGGPTEFGGYGRSGGSGGAGVSGWNTGNGGGSGTEGQGFEGGNAYPSYYWQNDTGGGGGGAGGRGYHVTENNQKPNGGIGISSSITGTSIYRAGGGRGWTVQGGLGTNGNGQTGQNTGGGGGAIDATTAVAGNSGIVIIRYKVS